MNVEQFWRLISESRQDADPTSPDGNMDRQIARLTELLTALPAQEVVDFDRHFSDRFIEAYNWDLWAAAYIIEGGCSDDGFMDFRSWLISMGQPAFTESLRDVESLVIYASDPSVEVCSFEEFQYVAGNVYGKQIDHAMTYPKDPTGVPWDEDSDELVTRFPKLWARFGE